MNIKDTDSIYPPLPFQASILLDHSDPHLACDQLHCSLEGPLDIAALEQAAQQMVDRHPILRTFFVWRRVDRPFQLVQRQRQLPLEQHDWRELSSEEQRQRLDGLLQREHERGFEPDKAPLVRLILCRTEDATHKLIVSYHRTIFDGKSARLFVQELLRLHAGGAQEPAGGSSYADYIAWLKTQDRSQANDFWQCMFAGFGSATPLTMERFSAAVPDGRDDFAEQSYELSHDLIHELRRDSEGLRTATLVHGVWALLLSRYSGEDDVVFGTSVDSFPTHLRRSNVLLGPFTNTLPLRVHINADMPVNEWLDGIRNQLLNVQRYAYTSLTGIQKLADLPFGSPLFESCVALESKAANGLNPQQYGDITLRDVVDVSADFPLTLSYDTDSGLFRIRYNRRRFEDTAITQVLKHAEILMEGLTRDSDRPLSSISMLTPQEEHQLVVEWNRVDIDYPQDQCIHWLVEEQVRKTPTATAVVFEDQQLTYQELNERANQLGHYLQAMGVGPEVLVAICMERSLDLIVGILAILKSGGAWVPLDPSYPADRLAFMLEDTQAPVLLTQEEVLDRLPSHWGQIVCVDALDRKLASHSKENPISATAGANLAYVM
ncbi:MAG TPA: condensation domain-containing protein, partial [Pyrinomonadaceae bacterium]|nr:condensation domain-containing protein [Pyrinomonadaceae bacterium]